MKTRSVVLILLLFGGVSADCNTAASTRFQETYDYYFPPHSDFVEGGYRKWYDKIVFGSRSGVKLRRSDQMMVEAIRGNMAAFRGFLHSHDRDAEGEFGETWTQDCLLVLLVYGDDRFADLLKHEDQKTKSSVANALLLTNGRRYTFPKTAALIPFPRYH